MTDTLTRAGYPPIAYPGANVAPGIQNGRVPLEGYQRACGLEFGELGAQIDAHPLYQEALEAARGRSVMAVDRLRNLFVIVTTKLEKLSSQDIIEFGSYRGGSLLFFAVLLKRLYPEAKVYGLDTFEGMPATDVTVDLHNEGDFSDTSLDEIKQAADSLGLDNIVFIKGLVEDTFPSQTPKDARFGLAHIDLDIYHPILHVQDVVWPMMSDGGYVVYDDATVSTCIGATQAVEELVIKKNVRSEQIFPHFVFRANLQETSEKTRG